MPEIDGRLLGSTLVANPYPFLARLRREAPVWRVPGSQAFFVSTWGLVAEAVARVGEFSNHFRHVLFTEDDGSVGVLGLPDGGAPDVFAGADPPDHTLHRKVFFPKLVEKKMSALEGHVADLADELIDDLLAAEQGDLVSMLANPLPLRVMAERVIGFRDVDVDELQRWVFAGSRYMGGRLLLDDMSQAATDAAPMLPWVSAQLDEALAAPSAGDVLAAAAAGVREGVLTRDEATFTLTVLLGAGSETTTSLIGNAVRILAERPALQEDLRTSLERVPAFIEEVLRYESPFRFHPRSATRATMLGGVAIPEGALVVLLWSSANRDEAVFDRPDEVLLDRPNERMHFGFGRGIHHCVGAPLARMESRIALTSLLRRTTSFALEPGDRPRWVDSLWVRRHDRLPVTLASR